MARSLTRTRAEQVGPDVLLQRRFRSLCAVGAPHGSPGAQLLPLYATRESPSVFSAVGAMRFEGSAHGRGVPLIRWDTPLWYLSRGEFPMPDGGRRETTLFTATSKMSCPSFSLPAGPPEEGGTCTAATRPAGGSGMRIVGRTYICDQCITGDAKILVRGEGLVRIDELAHRGTSFQAWSGLGWRWTQARKTAEDAEVVEIRTNFGYRIRLTPDHLVLTHRPLKAARGRRSAFVQAGALEVGRRLAFEPPSVSPFPDVCSLPFDPSEGREAGHFNRVDEFFPKNWSLEVGLFLGYIMGDGSLGDGRYPEVTLTSSEQDRGDLDRIRTIVRGWCSTETEVRVCEITPSSDLVRPARTSRQAHLHWRVQGLALFLRRLGLDKASPPELRRAPSSIFTANGPAVRGFLSGMFSTDGSVLIGRNGKDQGIRACVTLASVSRGLLEDIQLLLSAFGIRSSICAYKTSNEARLAAGYRALYKLDISSYDDIVRFEERVGFFNERKQKKLQDFLASTIPDARGRGRFPSVVAVEPAGHADVFDLIDVGSEHQFVANGFSVHNCYSVEGNYWMPEPAVAQAARVHWVIGRLEADPTGEALAADLVSAIVDVARGTVLGGARDGTMARLSSEIGVWQNGRIRIPAMAGRRRVTLDALSTPLPPDTGYPDAVAYLAATLRPQDGEVCGFFRIHDSGDFTVGRPGLWASYVRAWGRVARALPKVLFWAPTRAWGIRPVRDALVAERASASNFIVRPSALHVGDEPPAIPGLDAGTTVSQKPSLEGRRRGEPPLLRLPGASTPCPVYVPRWDPEAIPRVKARRDAGETGEFVEDFSCQTAGCRRCWADPLRQVSYGLH